MKRFLCFCLIGGVLSANAATPTRSYICSPFRADLASQTTCGHSSAYSSFSQYAYKHGVVCTLPYTGENVAVMMYGHCSTVASGSPSVGPLRNATGGVHKYCWCQMTEPVLSSYVRLPANTVYTSALECVTNCARDCASYMVTSSDFRGKIFGAFEAF
ncbi:MAG: hypothetical protein IJD41_03125 [Alphaproteobacteria bacterium]|nr:hypothetical protein [Alphaproteobacteria bacterium]MBQ7128283.1 hypothetical protein [Alphaproteobacteria bacterium]